MLFSSESTIQLFATRKQNVRRPPGKRYDKKYTVSTMKHPPSQMIWGTMSCNGTAGLYFFPSGKTMNGQKYLELLNNKLKIHMDDHNCNIFMHDGAFKKPESKRFAMAWEQSRFRSYKKFMENS